MPDTHNSYTKIAICEDEHNIRSDMARLVRKHRGVDCYVDCYGSGDALLRSGKKYDIYILDIHMPGISGMETARRIRDMEEYPAPVIIFTTALKQHMQEAFDVQAYHFLLKPVDEGKFISVLNNAVKECNREKEQNCIIIKSDGVTHAIAYNDILYAESFNKKVLIQATDRSIEYYGRISEFDGCPEFYRCHRCYAVNMDHIARYNSNTIWMKNRSTIPIAVKKYTQFVKAYMKHTTSDW